MFSPQNDDTSNLVIPHSCSKRRGQMEAHVVFTSVFPAGLRFVHPMEGDGHGALNLGPGDLWQVLGVQNEQVTRPLGAGGHHDGKKHTCKRRQAGSYFIMSFYHELCEDFNLMQMLCVILLTYHHPHLCHQESGQTGARRGRRPAPATPMSLWSSRWACRSAKNNSKQQQWLTRSRCTP